MSAEKPRAGPSTGLIRMRVRHDGQIDDWIDLWMLTEQELIPLAREAVGRWLRSGVTVRGVCDSSRPCNQVPLPRECHRSATALWPSLSAATATTPLGVAWQRWLTSVTA